MNHKRLVGQAVAYAAGGKAYRAAQEAKAPLTEGTASLAYMDARDAVRLYHAAVEVLSAVHGDRAASEAASFLAFEFEWRGKGIAG